MAEYIDRNLIEWYGCNFETPSCQNRECSGCSHAECSHTQVMQIPPADVIERSEYEKLRLVNLDLAETNKGLLAEHEQLEKLRSKIDKAIEEIDDLSCTIGDYSYSGGLEMAVEILKRNIGE